MSRTFLFRHLLGLVAGVILFGSAAMAQITSIPINVSAASGYNLPVAFGVHTSATNGIDDGTAGTTNLDEQELPPFGIAFEARFISEGPANLGTGSLKDYRPAPGGTQSYRLKFNKENNADYPVTLTWSSSLVSASYTGAVTMVDEITGTLVNVNMKTASSVTITSTGVTEVVISAAGAQTPAAGINATPCPVNFGIVQPLAVVNQNFTINNTGGSPLTVNSIALSDPNFVVTTPATFPQTIAAGGSLTVTVRFTASATTGPDNSNITITYNTSNTLSCSATATVSSGEGLYFTDGIDNQFDNQTSKSTKVGMKYTAVGTDRVQGLQFTVEAPYSILRINSVSLGLDLPGSPGNWNFDYEVTNAVSGSSVQVVLYGKDTTVNFNTGTYDDLFRINYEVRDTSMCNGSTACDSVQVHMTLMNVQSSLATYLGTTAGVAIDQDRKTMNINIYSSSARGDVNCDDAVNVLDLLEIIDHIQGRKTLAAWQKNRGDLHPWSSSFAASSIFCDGNNYGNNLLNVNDVVLITNSILNNRWPSGSQLMRVKRPETGAPIGFDRVKGEKESAAALQSAIYDVKFTVAVKNDGLLVDMKNVVPVKGIQLFMKAGGAPEDVEVNAPSLESFSITRKVVGDSLRIIIYSLSGDAISPMDGNLLEIPFTIADPANVMVIEPIVAGGSMNQGLKVEYELKVVTPAGVTGLEAAESFALSTSPNPFEETTTINFTLEKASVVTLTITDAAGNVVARLLDGTHTLAGTHKESFDAHGIANGTYFCTLSVDGITTTEKIVLAR